MKVICSGMPKTGTKSLAAALRILGYTVYDIEEQYLYLSNSLIEVIEKGWTTEKIKTMFKNVDAVTDMPSNILWEEIFQAFPDVKVGKSAYKTSLSVFRLYYADLMTEVYLLLLPVP